MFRRIAIKVGSNVLTREDGTLDFTRMSALVDQLAELRRAGFEIILISSGAVASGRSELRLPATETAQMDSVEQRQLFSAVGQAKLMGRYVELFRDHGIHVGQVLTMKENFAPGEQYDNQRQCMSAMLAHGVLPIVNENDTVCVTELMFTDNDELSGLVAQMMHCQTLVILSNIDGVFTGHPAEPNSVLIREVDELQMNRIAIIENIHHQTTSHLTSELSAPVPDAAACKANIKRQPRWPQLASTSISPTASASTSSPMYFCIPIPSPSPISSHNEHYHLLCREFHINHSLFSSSVHVGFPNG